jgi:hypothetical protein
MRTVTFAEPRVVDYLKRHFVLLWHNQAPERPSSPPADAGQQVEAYPEGSGGGNLRTYFCTADGKICYYLEGYWGHERCQEHAQRGHDRGRDLNALPAADRPARAGHVLTRYLWDLGDSRRRLRDALEATTSPKGSPAALEHAALGVLERAVLTSADLFAQPVAPILAELESKNRWIAYT